MIATITGIMNCDCGVLSTYWYCPVPTFSGVELDIGASLSAYALCNTIKTIVNNDIPIIEIIERGKVFISKAEVKF